jgi:hypothetical protein
MHAPSAVRKWENSDHDIINVEGSVVQEFRESFPPCFLETIAARESEGKP